MFEGFVYPLVTSIFEHEAFPLVTGLVGVFAGHRLALTMHRERARAIQSTLYKELKILRDDFSSWLPNLVCEYDRPLRDSYSGPGPLDLKLTFALVVELAATDKMITSDQRLLLSRMERMIERLKEKDAQRDVQIKKWIKQRSGLSAEEERATSSALTFWTSQLVFDVTQGIYYLNKLLSERNKFFLNDETTGLSRLESAFSFCDLEFSEEKWRHAIQRLGMNPDG